MNKIPPEILDVILYETNNWGTAAVVCTSWNYSIDRNMQIFRKQFATYSQQNASSLVIKALDNDAPRLKQHVHMYIRTGPNNHVRLIKCMVHPVPLFIIHQLYHICKSTASLIISYNAECMSALLCGIAYEYDEMIRYFDMFQDDALQTLAQSYVMSHTYNIGRVDVTRRVLSIMNKGNLQVLISTVHSHHHNDLVRIMLEYADASNEQLTVWRVFAYSRNNRELADIFASSIIT